jgi:tetratricopeptide (TPR) repeat protein
MAKHKTPLALPPRVQAEIVRYSKAGDRLAKQEKYEAALEQYRKAWALVPGDKTNWEASTQLLSSAGDCFFRLGDFERMANRFGRAVQCPGGLGNPYLHLRLGQGNFELGDKKGALDELSRAYLGAGDEIFKKEDPKYLALVRTKLRPPEPVKNTTAAAGKKPAAKKSANPPDDKKPVAKTPDKKPPAKKPLAKKPATKNQAAKKGATGRATEKRR